MRYPHCQSEQTVKHEGADDAPLRVHHLWQCWHSEDSYLFSTQEIKAFGQGKRSMNVSCGAIALIEAVYPNI